MIDLGGLAECGQGFAREQRAAAGRTPIGLRLFSEYRAALATEAFHAFKINGWGSVCLLFTLKLCTLRLAWWQLMWMER